MDYVDESVDDEENKRMVCFPESTSDINKPMSIDFS
jgi:hypothetical protein